MKVHLVPENVSYTYNIYVYVQITPLYSTKNIKQKKKNEKNDDYRMHKLWYLHQEKLIELTKTDDEQDNM